MAAGVLRPVAPEALSLLAPAVPFGGGIMRGGLAPARAFAAYPPRPKPGRVRYSTVPCLHSPAAGFGECRKAHELNDKGARNR